MSLIRPDSAKEQGNAKSLTRHELHQSPAAWGPPAPRKTPSTKLSETNKEIIVKQTYGSIRSYQTSIRHKAPPPGAPYVRFGSTLFAIVPYVELPCRRV